MSTATPQPANMLAANSPSKTASRRVLGDLTPKAINTPSKQTRAPDAMLSANPLKHAMTVSPSLGLDKENVTTSDAYSKGRKRTIQEVEEIEDVDSNAKAMFRGRDHIADSTTPLTTAAVRTYTENNPVGIPEPGSPTECNTPSPEPELNPDLANSQKSKESFSNFIDYQLCASQHSDVFAASNPAPAPAPATIAKDKKSRAELLRTRLGFGIYKVKTNQVDRRGSDIITTWETSSSLTESVNTSTSAAAVSSAESINSQPVPSITLSPVGRDSKPTFIKANLDPFRPIGKLTPAPLLLPTAVSSRMIHDYHMPSSPPHSVSPELLMSPVRHESSYHPPVAQRTRTDENEENDDVEDNDCEDNTDDGLLRVREKRFQEGDLTSSAVKGNAAKGLLELMSGKR